MIEGLGRWSGNNELGRCYPDALRIEGVFPRTLRLLRSKFASIEKSKEFTLVPWWAALERQRGKARSGVVRATTISWSLTRSRSLGISYEPTSEPTLQRLFPLAICRSFTIPLTPYYGTERRVRMGEPE